MSTGRKVCRKYWFSVEGETEKWYLEWLAREINASAEAKASVKFDIKVCKDPVSRVKQLVGVKELFHVFDIESQEPVHVAQVETTMDRLKKASSLKSTKCHPGYSNFSFELWIVLHKTNGRTLLAHRRQYLKAINSSFEESFDDLHEYKHEDKFKRILRKLTLADAIKAVAQANTIMHDLRAEARPVWRSGYEYFRENPSLSLHVIIEKILKDTGLIR